MVSLENWRKFGSRESLDYTHTKTFALGIVHVGLAVVQFGLIFALAKSLRVMTRTTLDARPDSIVLALLLGIVPGVVFGAVVPFLFQYFDYFSQLSSRPTVRVLVSLLTVCTYFALFFYHPVTSVLYAAAYVSSRVFVLTGIYGGHRIRATLA
ncbi:hypothetical protein ACFQJC_01175 [Haloferax namakaokahaiae]|uniref:DUF8100 domain-containing protein n=1 Tax=Haloferax namakaokahaiae TaxID=1748331 RepID=A0ABD5ZA67_9EURY